jgi:hypothetical protein
MQVGMIHAGPLTYAACQTGCNALVVACYAAAGQFPAVCPFFFFFQIPFCFSQGAVSIT